MILELADQATFTDQVKRSDVIYFRGGRTKSLLSAVRESRGWEKELDGKTVVGTSAGANFIAKYYYSLDDLEICEGLGILPVSALVHYRSDYNTPNIDWDAVTEELKQIEGTKLLTLEEGEFKILEKDI